MLDAEFPPWPAVVGGTTLGMLIADAPAVFLGAMVSGKIPFRATRFTTTTIFATLGIVTSAGFEFR